MTHAASFAAQPVASRLAKRWRILLILLGVAMIAALMALLAHSKQGALLTYKPPSLTGYVLNVSYQGDGNADGIKETHIRRYRSLDGGRIFSMAIQGRIWAWSLDSGDDDDSAIVSNYVIRDSDCDGLFDERYALAEPFHVPECLE